MFRKLTEYLIAFSRLLEAEGEAFCRAARRLALTVTLLMLAGLLMATGFGFLVAGLYLVMAVPMTPGGSALVTGGIVLAAGIVFAVVVLQAGR